MWRNLKVSVISYRCSDSAFHIRRSPAPNERVRWTINRIYRLNRSFMPLHRPPLKSQSNWQLANLKYDDEMWGINSHFRKRILFPVSEGLKNSVVALFVLINEWTGRLELPHLLDSALKPGEESEIWLLISHPNSLPHCNDPQVHDKQRCPCCLRSRSLFAWKLSKVQRICLVLLLVFTDTWHNICPPVSCLWKCPEIYTCPSPLATLFLSRATRLPPLRDAGNSVVKSPLMRLDMYETLFPFMAVRTLELCCRLDDFWIQPELF